MGSDAGDRKRKGEEDRTEYWMFTLFNILITVALLLTSQIVTDSDIIPTIVGMLYMLAVLLPALGVAVRRLHDTDRSGWWLLISLVPLVGGVVLLIFTVTEGQRSENKYGLDPKAGAL